MLTMGNAGMPYLDSIEVDEIHHPIRITERRLIADSEGAGKFRGAPGMQVVFGPVNCRIEVGYVSDGTVNPARGARGGLPAEPAQQFKRAASGELKPLRISDQVVLEPGELIVSLTAAGGGFGPPFERDPERVAHDVREKWITSERAAEVYGVIIDDLTGEVDRGATERRRRSLEREHVTMAR
jgi:N-methylhydantoinase B